MAALLYMIGFSVVSRTTWFQDDVCQRLLHLFSVTKSIIGFTSIRRCTEAWCGSKSCLISGWLQLHPSWFPKATTHNRQTRGAGVTKWTTIRGGGTSAFLDFPESLRRRQPQRVRVDVCRPSVVRIVIVFVRGCFFLPSFLGHLTPLLVPKTLCIILLRGAWHTCPTLSTPISESGVGAN